MGLCRADDIADVAYIASRNDVIDDCRLDGQHVWDDGPLRERPDGSAVIGECLFESMSRVNRRCRSMHALH